MVKKLSFLLVLNSMLLLTSCAASVKSTFQDSQKKLTIEDKVAFLDIQHEVPADSKKVGSSTFGDTMFSTDCGFDSNLIAARKIARENGANIVKVVKKKSPDIISTCYRITVDYYYYSGDVSNLSQYQLQIN